MRHSLRRNFCVLFDNVLNMCGERGGAEVWLNYLWFLGGGGSLHFHFVLMVVVGVGGGGKRNFENGSRSQPPLPPPSPRHLSNDHPLTGITLNQQSLLH